MYIDKLSDIVDKYNNKYHIAIKMKSTDLESNTHIAFGVENNDKDPKFEVSYHAKTSKYKNIFSKMFHLKLNKILWLKIKNSENVIKMLWKNLKVKKLLKHIMKKNFKRQIKQNLELEKCNTFLLSGKAIIIHLIFG